MTKDEAIGILNETQVVYFAPNGKKKVQEALDMAIESLLEKSDDSKSFSDSAEPSGDLISREDALKKWDDLSERGRTEFDQVLMTLPSADRPTCDLISREDALRELNGVCSTWEDDAKVADIISAMPSASDLISRADAIEAVCDVVMSEYDLSPTYGYEVAEKALKALPSAEPSIVRCGACKWYYCKACFGDVGLNNGRNVEDFCSYGERRE